MPRYMETAAQANEVAKELMDLIHALHDDAPEQYGKAAEMIARLVNLGIRCSPRGVQHTVRLNAVQRAVRGLPVRVSMKEVTDEKTGRTYNALVTVPIVPDNRDMGLPGIPTGTPTIEGASEGEDS